jgi:hypothetical protein
MRLVNTRERKYSGTKVVKGHLPCFPLATAQGLLLVALNLLTQQNM